MTRAATTLGATLLILLSAACASSEPLPEYQRDERRGIGPAPRVAGEGDCRTQVNNVSPRPLEVYYHLGLQNPPRTILQWSVLGILEPGEESVILADCDDDRIQVNGYVLGPTTPGRESSYVTESRSLVEGRLEVIRLRTAR